MSEITSIKLTKITKKKLAKHGEKGDTFEEIVKKLLKQVRDNGLSNRQ